MRNGSLFSGYGGLDLAVERQLAADTVWHVDTDTAASAVLAARWPNVPNLGDVVEIDWTAVEPVDVLTGGFPCQDVSVAGHRAGMTPTSRSGLWEHMAQAVHMLHPRLVVIENVKGLLSADAHCDVEPCPWCMGNTQHRPLRALGAVLGDLASLGYDASWCGLRAADIGAPHARYRVFVVATDAASDGWHEGRAEPVGIVGGPDAALGGATVPHTHRPAVQQRRQSAPGQTPRGRARANTCRRGGAPAADTESLGQQTRHLGGGDPTQRPEFDGDHVSGWGAYAAAIDRWQHVIGRVAPEPTQVGHRGGSVLSPTFVEWLMGLDPGHVTAVDGLSRNDQLRLLGNGVVPQQAECALAWLLDEEVAA